MRGVARFLAPLAAPAVARAAGDEEPPPAAREETRGAPRPPGRRAAGPPIVAFGSTWRPTNPPGVLRRRVPGAGGWKAPGRQGVTRQGWSSVQRLLRDGRRAGRRTRDLPAPSSRSQRPRCGDARRTSCRTRPRRRPAGGCVRRGPRRRASRPDRTDTARRWLQPRYAAACIGVSSDVADRVDVEVQLFHQQPDRLEHLRLARAVLVRRPRDARRRRSAA